MSLTERDDTAEGSQGGLATLVARFRPPVITSERTDDGSFRITVRTTAGPREYWVWHPQVYLKNATARDVARDGGQLAYKLVFGYLMNLLGYKFFVFLYYLFFQNPVLKPIFDNPIIIWHWLEHFWTHRYGISTPPDWYVTIRHFCERDAMEWTLRGVFFWIGFVVATSRKRQWRQHGRVAVWLSKPKVIPTEVQDYPTRWWQWPFLPPAMILGALPIILVVFGLGELAVLFHWVTYAYLIANGPKYAGIVAAILVVHHLTDKVAIDQNYDVVEFYRRRPRGPRFPWPATIRSLYTSGMTRPGSNPDDKQHPFARLVIVAVALLIGYYVGTYVLANSTGWLAKNTLYGLSGYHHLFSLDAVKTVFWHHVMLPLIHRKIML